MGMNAKQSEALLELAERYDQATYEMKVDDAVRVTFEQNGYPYDFVDFTINPDGTVERGHPL